MRTALENSEEREQNRQRKLRDVQCREWDISKMEGDYPRMRRYNPCFRGGAYSGVQTPSHRHHRVPRPPLVAEAASPAVENRPPPSPCRPRRASTGVGSVAGRGRGTSSVTKPATSEATAALVKKDESKNSSGAAGSAGGADGVGCAGCAGDGKGGGDEAEPEDDSGCMPTTSPVDETWAEQMEAAVL